MIKANNHFDYGKFYNDLLLLSCYKMKTVSTNKDDLNKLFGIDDEDSSFIEDNVLNGKETDTSYVKSGLLSYDSEKETLSITERGEEIVEERYNCCCNYRNIIDSPCE